MAVVTVNQNSAAATSRYRPVPYLVQRSFRPGYNLNDAKRQTIGNLLGGVDALNTLLYHWSGLNWQQKDFAPTTMGDTAGRVWRGTANGQQGLDEVIDLVGGSITYSSDTRTESDLKVLRDSNAGHADSKVMIVMHNHPQAMMPAGWPVQADTGSRNWPLRTQWGSAGAGTLATEILTRYSGYIRGFSYGQEIKAVANAFRNGLLPGGTLIDGDTSTDISNLSPNNIADHIEGYNHFAKYMRANHPGIELWMGHLDIFGHGSTEVAAEIDALLAGGDQLGNNADHIITEMIGRIGRDPDTATFPALGTFDADLLPDAFTIDVSIASSTANRWRNDYAEVLERVALVENVCRVIYDRMMDEWGFTIPIVAIESYFDWEQHTSTFTADQQAALSTAIAMRSLMGELYEEARWEPQGGDLGSGGIYRYASFASWWTPYDPETETTVASPNQYVYDQFYQVRDLSNAFPPGTTMCTVTSDNASIMAVASASDVYILNTSGGAISTSVTATNGSLGAQSIPAYGYLVQSLPTGTSVDDTEAASGTGTAYTATTRSGVARLVLRF